MAIIAHGLSIVLFFHLVAKCTGISIGWRIAIDAIFPTLIYTVYYATTDRHDEFFVLATHEMFVLYFIKFFVCSMIAEFSMRELEKRVGRLGSPRTTD